MASTVSVAAQQNAAIQAANLAAAGIASSNTSNASTTSNASSSATQATNANALASLTSNFNDFLSLLTTQLQNQDPTSPMDTNQFTSQLVEMANVEQQINTNADLTSLVQLTQGSDILQSSGIVGQTVTVSSNELSLQNGTATINYTAPAAETVAIAVYNSSGQQVGDFTANAQAGSNTWQWNGQNSNGVQMADGVYKVAVEGADSTGATTALPFTVTGTATSVQQGANNSGLQLYLGSLAVPFSSVQSITPKSTASSGN
jgi:flagellar basal-body rod modification protein FlgD